MRPNARGRPRRRARGRARALRAAGERRAGARLRGGVITRNFDAKAPEPAPGPYHRFSARKYIKTMNDFSRAPRVLVVEDDEDIAQALQRSLRMEGYEVRAAPDGPTALEDGRSFAPDLVILDLGLPGLDGVEVARTLRAEDDVPILILTARDALESRVEGLDAGADDYLVKPFERQELLARMRALLRRRPPRGSAPLRVGDLSLNVDTHEVVRGERAVDLTQREFELLEYLMRNERIVISRQRLLDEVWGYDPFSTTNTIEVFVSNLRRKLEASGEPRLLHTIGSFAPCRAPPRALPRASTGCRSASAWRASRRC
jgi:two-component system, OmpR family, response regulator MprA